MNVNKKKGNMKKIGNWITNRLDKWFKFKEMKLLNVEIGDMKWVGCGLIVIGLGLLANAGSNTYLANKGVNVHQNVEINIIKRADGTK